MTMKRKTLYEAPTSELLLVKFEENFCGTNGLPDSPVTPVPDPWDDEDIDNG